MIRKVATYLARNQVILALLVVAGFFFIREVKSVLATLFIAFIISAAFKPLVRVLTQKRVPLVLAVMVPYFLAFSLLIVIVIPLIPFLVNQADALINNFPFYLEQFNASLGLHISVVDIDSAIRPELANLGQNFVQTTGKVFGSLFSLLTIFVVSIYLLLEQENFEKGILSLFPERQHEKVRKTLSKIEDKLGAWLRGQFILCLFIGLITYIALSILGVRYALVLAIIAGVLEIVPTLGPVISAVPAVIIALSYSPHLALLIILAYILIQLFENHFLVPQVMNKALGLSPIVIIVGVILGAQLMGIIGALLAIPFIAVLSILWQTLREEN